MVCRERPSEKRFGWQKLYLPTSIIRRKQFLLLMFRFRKCVSQPEMVSRMFLSYHTHHIIPHLLFSLIINLLFVMCVWFSQRTKVFLFVSNFSAKYENKCARTFFFLLNSYRRPQSTYIYRAPQCMSPRRNWDSPTPLLLAGVPSPPDQRVGGILACG